MDLLEITDNKNRHPWEIARKIIVSKLIDKTQKKNIKILDIGSGDAFLANSFTKRSKNYYTYCVDTEYTTELINEIEDGFKNKNLKLHSTLNDVKVDKIDITTLLDVIEHVPVDIDFLNGIISKPYINNTTHFIITVPAYNTLVSEHDELLKHYRRYNLKSLKQTVNKCNLDVIDGGYFFTILILPRLVQILLKKINIKKGKKNSTLGTWKGGKLITTIIKSILLLDYKINRCIKVLGINLPGLSCYVICKKRI